jgi:hypothetical protein
LRKGGVCHIFVQNIIGQTNTGSNRLTSYDKVFHIIFFSNLKGEGVLTVCEIFVATEIISKTSGK